MTTSNNELVAYPMGGNGQDQCKLALTGVHGAVVELDFYAIYAALAEARTENGKPATKNPFAAAREAAFSLLGMPKDSPRLPEAAHAALKTAIQLHANKTALNAVQGAINVRSAQKPVFHLNGLTGKDGEISMGVAVAGNRPLALQDQSQHVPSLALGLRMNLKSLCDKCDGYLAAALWNADKKTEALGAYRKIQKEFAGLHTLAKNLPGSPDTGRLIATGVLADFISLIDVPAAERKAAAVATDAAKDAAEREKRDKAALVKAAREQHAKAEAEARKAAEAKAEAERLAAAAQAAEAQAKADKALAAAAKRKLNRTQRETAKLNGRH